MCVNIIFYAMDTNCYVAFDLGATSGRTILGRIADGRLTTQEVTRFPNAMYQLNGLLYWNIYSLFDHIKDGLRAVARMGVSPTSIGIDTWGVDFVSVDGDGAFIGLPTAYRSDITLGASKRFFDDVMSADRLYATTGIQHMDFNTIFRLNDLKNSTSIKNASKLLFMPDALSYMLTGKSVTEYTIASTGAILDPCSREVSAELIGSLGLSSDLFGPMVSPGTVIGTLLPSVSRETGLGAVPVVAVAGHDTASAVAAVPARTKNFAYLSSGTWSLMGIESPRPVINEITVKNNITNEGGVDGTIRLLKNITGMWIIEQCLKKWKEEGQSYSYPEMVSMAESAPEFTAFIDPDDAMFVCPSDMPAAIDEYCRKTGQRVPANHGEYVRVVFESLALKYRMVLDMLEALAPERIECLHIIGGGSRNALLNTFTASAIGRKVIAGPAEASALGNVLMQARASGQLSSLDDGRRLVADSIEQAVYEPVDVDKWSSAYHKYKETILKNKQ